MDTVVNRFINGSDLSFRVVQPVIIFHGAACFENEEKVKSIRWLNQ